VPAGELHDFAQRGDLVLHVLVHDHCGLCQVHIVLGVHGQDGLPLFGGLVLVLPQPVLLRGVLFRGENVPQLLAGEKVHLLDVDAALDGIERRVVGEPFDRWRFGVGMCRNV
jgi:hypothetical protein